LVNAGLDHLAQKGHSLHTTHWFLSDGKTVIDPTKKQFRRPIKYDGAIGCGFLTKKPSKRGKLLIARIKQQGA
jgi:hypothetical protein